MEIKVRELVLGSFLFEPSSWMDLNFSPFIVGQWEQMFIFLRKSAGPNV